MAWDPNSIIGGEPATDRRKPHAPREFTAYPLDGGGLTATWKDQGDPVRGIVSSGNMGGNHPPIVHSWFLHVCPIQLAGTSQDPAFPLKVLSLSTAISSIPSRGRGDYLKLTVADPEMRDVYAQIVGLSNDNIVGYPTQPLMVAPLNPPTGPLNDITDPDLDLVQVLDIYGNEFVELNPTYTAPLVLGRFFGVQIVVTGYFVSAQKKCLGNVVFYEGKPAGQIQTGSIIVPDDPSGNPVTAYFVSMDRFGKHVDDITTAPSVALAGGIHV